MIIVYYKIDKSIMISSCYKDGKLIMTSLIIIKIKFVRFEENKIDGLHARSHARLHNHSFCNHNVIIAIFFGISIDKQIIVKKLFATR